MYTPFCCEENIWHLGKQINLPADVLILCNNNVPVCLFNQPAAEPGEIFYKDSAKEIPGTRLWQRKEFLWNQDRRNHRRVSLKD